MLEEWYFKERDIVAYGKGVMRKEVQIGCIRKGIESESAGYHVSKLIYKNSHVTLKMIALKLTVTTWSGFSFPFLRIGVVLCEMSTIG